MSVRVSPRARPCAMPEHVLWTLVKNHRTVEARTTMTPPGPELRIYASSPATGRLMLLWSQVPSDGREVGELAETHRALYLAKGYLEAVEQTAATGPHRSGRVDLPKGPVC